MFFFLNNIANVLLIVISLNTNLIIIKDASNKTIVLAFFV